MPEPTVAQVRSGFDTTLEDAEISGFVDDAGVLLRQAYDASDLDDDTDTTLWKYLARHLIRHEPDRQQERKGLGSAQVEYSGQFGDGLRATSPGQTALRLDPEGKLADLDTDTDDLFFRSL